MRKHISLIAGVLVITALTVPIVYATNNNFSSINKVQESKFFTTDVTEVAQNDTITMTIDLSKIDYDDFEFTLLSDISVTNIVADATSQENVSVNEKENKITIISNKSDINMDKIELYYKVPEGTQVGTKINLKASISEYAATIASNNEDTNIISNSISNTISQNVITNINEESTVSKNNNESSSENNQTIGNNNIENANNSKNETQEIEITITVVESTNNSNSGIQNNGNNSNNGTQNGTSLGAMSGTSTSSKTGTTGVTTTAQTVMYNGSYDNYLSSIEIEGYTLSPEFSKTTSTYFLTVANDVTSINVNATKSDENAKVQIYGNDSLEEGENKILISVTAENGSVRTYRIYVTRD